MTDRDDRRAIRFWLALFMAGLVLSGVTAFPLQTEVHWLLSALESSRAQRIAETSHLLPWIARVDHGLADTDARYPFLAYGTDWLAFAHLVLAILFVGPYRDPIRNKWVITFGLIACGGVIPLALIAGHIRGIPIAWRLIDCSFGVFGLFLFCAAGGLSRNLSRLSAAARRDVVEADEVDVVAFAVLGYFKEIEDAEESRGAGKLRGDVGEADWLDGVDFDLAFFHAVAGADGHVRACPDADAAGDLAAADSFAKVFGERHEESLAPLSGYQGRQPTTGSLDSPGRALRLRAALAQDDDADFADTASSGVTPGQSRLRWLPCF